MAPQPRLHTDDVIVPCHPRPRLMLTYDPRDELLELDGFLHLASRDGMFGNVVNQSTG